MRLGLDFDNTLISYDELFYHAAVDNDLIPKEIAAEKNAVRDYLRAQNNEDRWTWLQGEVYGNRILEANPYPHMLAALSNLAEQGVEMYIVSHKTKTPYLGKPWDLHAAARSWLAKHGFHDQDKLNWHESRAFFEPTKREKIARIQALGCTHYIDDLPEILEMLPSPIQKILFDPNNDHVANSDWHRISSWSELPPLLSSAL